MYDIGDRIKQLRGRVFTQAQLADAAGVSRDLVKALEQGKRRHAAIGSLNALAHALDVDTADLLGSREAVPTGDGDAGVVALRRVLSPVDDLVDDPNLDEPTVGLVEARRTVDYIWGSYWAGKYDELAAMLPTALAQLRATAHAAHPEQTTAAYELVTRAYWATGCTLVHLGQADPAWQAIRQAHEAAQHTNDELLAATVVGSMSWQLLVQGRYDESRRVAVTTAETLEPSGHVSLPHLSAYGSLVLTAATAAGRDFRIPDAQHLVAQADDVAGRIGHDRRDYETYFGPSQVTMQSVDVGVVTEDYTAALNTARMMPTESGLPLASRCRHVTDQAMAHARLGHTQHALDALLTAEAMGPDWIKHQTLPRRIVADLLAQKRTSRMRQLAQRLGVTG